MRFPLAPAALLALSLAGCGAADAPRTVVTLGDSVPAGTACSCSPFPALYARSQHATDVNLAVPGMTAADVLSAVPAERHALSTASEVVIMAGANDIAGVVGQPSAYAPAANGVRDDVVSTVTAIERIHRVRVVVLGYWNVVEDGQVGAAAYGPDGVRDAARATEVLNTALREAAARTGALFVPTVAAFHGPSGDRDPTGLLAADGDHPDAAGHAVIAALLPPLP
ncbi:SGNH/GDSL hydrolase family protein [Actinoplanes missouriensis]|uniref:SGNH/GDSL hydrolase family protein n=1 Tax=Actinoplanes missouriensis TaxID=1866 RepID=UPI0033C69EC3